MNNNTRRIVSATALALAVIFAAAAATQAEATFLTSPQSQVVETTNKAQPHTDAGKTAAAEDCAIKPRWTQVWSNEKSKLVWKKEWVERCQTGH